MLFKVTKRVVVSFTLQLFFYFILSLNLIFNKTLFRRELFNERECNLQLPFSLGYACMQAYVIFNDIGESWISMQAYVDNLAPLIIN